MNNIITNFEEFINENLEDEIIVDENPELGNFLERVTFNKKGAILDIGKYSQSRPFSVIEMHVPDENRRQGIATELMKKALGYFKGEGFVAQTSNPNMIVLNYGLGLRTYDNDLNELTMEETIERRNQNSSVSMTTIDVVNKYYK